MITNREIPREEWLSFFNNFSRQYHGWSIFLEILDSNIGAQTESKKMSFAGITADLKDTENTVLISAGESVDDHITHSIRNPVRIYVEQPGEGTPILEIETGDKTKTLLRFVQL